MSSVAATAASTSAVAATAPTKNDAGSEDRFLKLLVAQMQNQDPLNPLDNAQVTSQMAQINTVSGIEKLNATVAGLNSQFVQLQALQGASLVGREVIVAGDRLAIGEGIGSGGFDLKAAADGVKVEVLNGAGRVAATIDLGAMSAGRHAFDWPSGSATDADGYRFRVAATSGSANVLGGTLMHDRVEAVSSSGNSLELELRHSGLVSYDAVRAIQ